jgi:hypothetical protein
VSHRPAVTRMLRIPAAEYFVLLRFDQLVQRGPIGGCEQPDEATVHVWISLGEQCVERGLVHHSGDVLGTAGFPSSIPPSGRS